MKPLDEKNKNLVKRNTNAEPWPRIKDLGLTSDQQADFNAWLDGQTRPWIPGVLEEEQDGYFEDDYNRWKAGGRVND